MLLQIQSWFIRTNCWISIWFITFVLNSRQCNKPPANNTIHNYQVGVVIPLTGLAPPHFSACPKHVPGFPMSYVVVCFMLNELRDWLFSWYWCIYCSSLFKLSFHNTIVVICRWFCCIVFHAKYTKRIIIQ